MEASATLSNYRQAPRKVALIADLIRGKRAEHALVVLAHLPKRGSDPMAKLVKSAIANARSKGAATADLFITRIEVGKGLVMKRTMPRARGRGAPIRKKMSHISLTVAEKPREKKAPQPRAKKKAETPAEPVAA